MDNKVTAKNIYIYNKLIKNGFTVSENSLLKKTIVFRKMGFQFKYTPSIREGTYSNHKSFDAPSVESLIVTCNNITIGLYPPTLKQLHYLRKLCEITGTEYDKNWSTDSKKCSEAISRLKCEKDQMKLDQYYPKTDWQIYDYPKYTNSSDLTQERFQVEGNWRTLRAELTGFGYVYVIDGGDKCKIGKSKQPKQRVRGLISQSGLPKDSSYKIFGPLTDHGSCETYCHKTLAESRIPGSEWFSLDFEYCVDQVSQCISDKGFVLTEKKIEEIQEFVKEDYIKEPKVCFKKGKVKWFWNNGVFKGYEKSRFTRGPVSLDHFIMNP